MVEGFEWDPDKARANLRKHGVSFADAAKVFDEFSRSEWLDERADYGEDRFITVGEVSGRVLVIAYSMRGDNRRIIRPRNERRGSTMATVRHNRKNLPTGETDWQALDQLSDEEVERLARSDPDGQPLTDKDFEKLKRLPRVRIVRMALGMTQEEFAEAYGIPVATLRDWEQCRRQPDTSVKSYLRVIERLPKQVREALAPEPRSVTEGA